MWFIHPVLTGYKTCMKLVEFMLHFLILQPPSSAPSTPERKSKTPSGAENLAPLPRSPGPSEESATVTMFAPVGTGGGGDTSDYASEGEITSSVSDILFASVCPFLCNCFWEIARQMYIE